MEKKMFDLKIENPLLFVKEAYGTKEISTDSNAWKNARPNQSDLLFKTEN